MPRDDSDRYAFETETDPVQELRLDLQGCEDDLEAVCGDVIAMLRNRGMFRVHREWSQAGEEARTARTAAKAALRAIITDGWADVPVRDEWVAQ